MVYVALSRVQGLSQLYILEELPVNKIKPWRDAVEEMERINELDQARTIAEISALTIISLNVRSLASSYLDILSEKSIKDI